MKRPLKHTPKKNEAYEAKFLDLLANSGNVTLSAKGANVTRVVVYDRRRVDPVFAAKWDDALAEALELLEATAWQRARKQSDLLLIFLLKSYKPERFADRLRIEGNINITQVNEAVRALTEAGLDASQVFNDLIAKAKAKVDSGK